MDTKQFFISISFAIVTTMLINYFVIDRFFSKDTQEIQSGQAFRIAPFEHMNKPLVKEVNFLDEDIVSLAQTQPEMHVLVTPYYDVTFTSQGGTVSQLICKKVGGNAERSLTIISPDAHGAFLLAFDGATPLHYNLVGQEYNNGTHIITYASQSVVGLITKQFKIHDANYVIELKVTIDPRGVQFPRILFPAPQLVGAEKTSNYNLALVNSSNDGIQRLKMSEIEDKAFASPTLCGVSDRYFVNVLIKNDPSLAQRCYFVPQKNILQCVVEGPEISSLTTWELSWYCGPKEFEPLEKSDIRLTELLDYGWFTHISRPLLFMLKFLYSFVQNFGLAIIILTVLLNLMMLPFTSRGEKSIQKATDLSKKMQYLEQKYKHDKERLAQEKSELMQKHGSVDAIGCVSFLLQTVFFIGLNKVLTSSVELYRAPFAGWIQDLSAKDPYYILPFCVFLGIVIPAMTAGGKADIRQRAISFAFGLFILGIMANLSAGLVLFILTNVLTRVAITWAKKLVA